MAASHGGADNWWSLRRVCDNSDLIGALGVWREAPRVLVDRHRVVYKVRRGCACECVLEILRVQLEEWVLSEGNIVVDQVRVLKILYTGLQIRQFDLVQEDLRVEVRGQWVNLNDHIVVAWLRRWGWYAEHVELDFLLVGPVLELLLHSPLQEDWMLIRESVIEVTANVVDSAILNQFEADIGVLTGG